jgi:hypothetical protein
LNNNPLKNTGSETSSVDVRCAELNNNPLKNTGSETDRSREQTISLEQQPVEKHGVCGETEDMNC